MRAQSFKPERHETNIKVVYSLKIIHTERNTLFLHLCHL